MSAYLTRNLRYLKLASIKGASFFHFFLCFFRTGHQHNAVAGIQYGGLEVASLLSEDVVLLVSSNQDLQHTPEKFEADCEAPAVRISTSKSELMVLSHKRADVPFR